MGIIGGPVEEGIQSRPLPGFLLRLDGYKSKSKTKNPAGAAAGPLLGRSNDVSPSYPGIFERITMKYVGAFV